MMNDVLFTTGALRYSALRETSLGPYNGLNTEADDERWLQMGTSHGLGCSTNFAIQELPDGGQPPILLHWCSPTGYVSDKAANTTKP